MDTYYLRKKDLKKNNILIDATGLSIGRLASRVSLILRGKNKPDYTPFQNCGDRVVIINASNAVLSTKSKIYYKHTGYMGGLKVRKADDMKMSEIIKLAVKRMLPGNKLSYTQIKSLHVYDDSNHIFRNIEFSNLDLNSRIKR